MDFLIEPLQHAFILRGLIGGLLTAVICSILSTFVVWRKMAFMGDALAHSILPGIVVAYTLGINLFWGALGTAFFVVIGIAAIANHGRLREDTAIGVVFAGFFALGILMLGKTATFLDLSHILFGNILGVSQKDLVIVSVATLVVVLILGLFYKEIVVTSFDPAHSTAIGLSPDFMRCLVLVLLAIATVVAIQTVGVVLVLALLVTPGAAASLLFRKLHRIIVLSIFLAVFAAIAGFYASYYIDIPSGPAIVLVLSIEFLLCALLSWISGKKNRFTLR